MHATCACHSRTWDFFSDILFATVIYTAWHNQGLDDKMYMLMFMFCVLATVVPWIVNGRVLTSSG